MIPEVKVQISSLFNEVKPHWKKGVDLGVGRGEALPILREYTEYLIGVDHAESEIKFAKGYDELTIADIKEYNIPVDVDVVFLFDVIEHLYRQDGIKLLTRLQVMSSVIITTPGRYFEEAGRGQRHVSLWTINDFQKLGYNVELFRARTVWFFTMSMILAYRIARGERF